MSEDIIKKINKMPKKELLKIIEKQFEELSSLREEVEVYKREISNYQSEIQKLQDQLEKAKIELSKPVIVTREVKREDRRVEELGRYSNWEILEYAAKKGILGKWLRGEL